MPLFRRQSEKCRKRQQDQELLAQQDPEPRFDLTSCELTEVPSGVYTMCKILQKQVLLLHDNWLQSLSGGDIVDLKLIKVLDLHNNELKSLPEDFGSLTHLQVLDLSNNRLKHLPRSFEELSLLQTLNLRNNRFKSLPDAVIKLRCLRTLDISQNEIEGLPANMCYAKALETLVLDVDKIKYPSHEICSQGTAAIMMFLCGQAGIEYEHPSKYWLKIQATNNTMKTSISDGSLNLSQIESQMMQGVQAYQTILDQKRRDAEELDKILNEEQEAQAELAARAAEDHRRLLSSITQHDEQDISNLEYLNNRKDEERKEFLMYLKELEYGASNLLSELLDYNTKAKEMEVLLEIMEKERMKEDSWFKVRWEEVQNLRKQEILDNMEMMLTESDLMEATRMDMELNKDETRRDALEQEYLDEGQIESVINHTYTERKFVVQKLAEEDELQKAAFEALLYSQDLAHSRIRSQIFLIESELTQITALEMDKRAKRMAYEFSVVADQRVALSAMLSQLLEEKEKRQIELKKRLIEMELQREDGQQDFWLVQYQRLLDWKPQSLIDRESQLDAFVKDVLITSGAEDYLPVLARHQISSQTLIGLTDSDLRQMGVHEVGLRRAILQQTQLLSNQNADDIIKNKLEEASTPSQVVTPTAPPMEMTRPPKLPSALLERQFSVTARGLNSECAICLDKQSSIIFLMCGHVCCCASCAQSIKDCPLCRATVSAKIRLSVPSQIAGC